MNFSGHSIAPVETNAVPVAGERFFSKPDVIRALLLVLMAVGIGVGLNFVRKPPLAWSYRSKAERLMDEAAAFRGGGAAGQGNVAAAFPRVGLAELRAVMAAGKVVVIDARPALFFRTGHLPGAVNLPREGFQVAYEPLRARLERDRNQALVVYCQGGSCEDSDLIAAALRSLGFAQLTIFAGGWKEWQASGLPVEVGA